MADGQSHTSIIIISIIVLIVFVFFFVFTIVMTRRVKTFRINKGSNSVGNWVTIGTWIGTVPSYYFTGKTLYGENGYLVYPSKLSPTPDSVWDFDGQFLSTSVGGISYYLSYNGTLFSSPVAQTTWFFDGFNFYLSQPKGNGYIASYLSTDLTIVTIQAATQQELVAKLNLYVKKPGWTLG